MEPPKVLDTTLDRTRPAVLAVDDTDRLAALTLHLERAGFDLATVVDRGVDVLDVLATHDVGLIIVDESLLGGLGHRLLKALRAAAPDCRIVVLDRLGSSRSPALNAGADAVLRGDDLTGLRSLLDGEPRPASEAQTAARGSRSTNPPRS